MPRILLDHPGVALALSFAVWVFALVHAWRLTYLHDEGIFTFEFARLMADHFWPVFFVMRSKPVITALYVPFTPLGLTAYLLVHGTLAAATVWLVCRTARHMRLGHPNAAGWTLALSTGYLVASAAGMANTDGAFFMALTFWAYFGKRRYLAAGILGVLPFVRLELGAVWLAFVLWDGWKRRDYRFTLTAAAFPAIYYVGAAFFLADPLWPFTHFPAPAGKPPDIAGFGATNLEQLAHYLRNSLVTTVGLFGLVGLLGWPRARDGARLVFLLAYAVLAFLMVSLYFDLFGFDTSWRYLVVLLPLLGWMTAHALSSGARLPWGGVLALSVVLLWRGVWVLPVLAGLVALWQLLPFERFRLPSLATLGLLALGAAALPLGLQSSLGRAQHQRSHRVMAAVRATGLYHGQPIYTDLNIARYDRCSRVNDAYMLANEAILWELERYFPGRIVPRKALARTLAKMRFVVEPAKHRVRRDALYLLRGGPRTRVWRHRVEAAAPQRLRVGAFWLYYWPPPPRPPARAPSR